MNKNKLGKVTIDKSTYEENYHGAIIELFKAMEVRQVRVVTREYLVGEVVEILGYSKSFKEIKEGEVIPQYGVIVTKVEQTKENPLGGLELKFEPDYDVSEFKKRNPDFKPWPESKREIGKAIDWLNKVAKPELRVNTSNHKIEKGDPVFPKYNREDIEKSWEAYIKMLGGIGEEIAGKTYAPLFKEFIIQEIKGIPNLMPPEIPDRIVTESTNTTEERGYSTNKSQ